VTDEVVLAALPGPLSGRHVARLSNRSDVAQLLDEITTLIGATPRSPAKVDKSITTLLAAHAQYIAAQAAPPSKNRIETRSKEPTVAGVPFSELVSVLKSETVTIPAKHAGGKEVQRRVICMKNWDCDFCRTDWYILRSYRHRRRSGLSGWALAQRTISSCFSTND
jgi:hypothetical protein